MTRKQADMERAQPTPGLAYTAGVPLLIATLALLSWLVGLLQPLDNWLSDQRFRFVSHPPTGQVVLVALDAKSLAALGVWPLPRSTYGRLIDQIRSLGSTEIALDVDFSAASDPREDAALAQALERFGGGAILAGFNQKLTAGFGEEKLTANRPIAMLAQHSWVGGAGVHPDVDGVVRRFGYGERLAGEAVPSIPTMLAGAKASLDASFVIDFGIRADAIDQIPAIDLLNGNVDRDRIAGKKVIVGATAAELRDFFQVPRYGPIPGALLEALSADVLLQGRALEPASTLPLALLLVSMALVFALFGNHVRWTVMLFGLALMAVAVEAGAVALPLFEPMELDTAPADVALFAFALTVVVRESRSRGLLVFSTGRELGNTRALLDQVVADSFAGIVIVDEQGRVEVASRSAAAMLGRQGEGEGKDDSEGDFVGGWLSELAPPELEEACKRAMRELRSGQWRRDEPAEIKLRINDWLTRTLEYVVTPSRLSAVTHDGAHAPDRLVCCLMLRDVTEQREAETRLAYLANFDPVTGLPNRRQLNEHLARVLANFGGNRCAVIALDLDRFKNVNDTLGHRIGDLLLKQVAERARAGTSRNDLVARLGGDEYVIVLADHGSEADISHFTATLIERLGQPYEVHGHRVLIGASAGIALAWMGKSGQELMKDADTALYRAKAEGGNCYRLFEPSMDAALRGRQALELDCWDALEHDQFALVYQPQVDLTTGRITGVETLLRWNHPTRGPISPVEFIPVVEDTGMIEILGAWVLREACIEVAHWPGELKVAVNVSPIQFQRGDLVKTVEEALRVSNLPPERLDLEITESLFVTQNAAVTTAVNALRAMGVSFSLDDFGTGYSSLSYLRKFPVNKIKIDKSFVQGIPQDRQALAVIRAVSTLAQNLGIRMNAEGIEEEAQVHLLRMLGCHEGQGYFFSKPKPPAEILKMVESESTPAQLQRVAS